MRNGRCRALYKSGLDELEMYEKQQEFQHAIIDKAVEFSELSESVDIVDTDLDGDRAGAKDRKG